MREPAPISLVLCSHNPEPRCLKRCLAALQTLLERHPEAELVVVDNNSNPPLSEAGPLRALLAAQPQATLIQESRQGLCWARQRGIAATSAPWVLFVDDDNELAPDYLEVLLAGIARFHDVAAWGPGVIDVEFLDPVPEEIQAHPEWFQRRHESLAYGCLPGSWQPCYPNGSGFAIRREVLQIYSKRLAAGELTATGRSGASMASAEDIQIVWEAIRLGWAAGMLPHLHLNHLIPAGKTSLNAVSRHGYGISFSYYPALVQSWPESAAGIPAAPAEWALLRRLLVLWLKRRLCPEQRFQANRDLGLHLGFACGLSAVHRDRRHGRYLAWARRLGVI